MKKTALILLLILVLALCLRLYHVNQPFLDHHSWRQTQTAMIAKNFLHNDFNIFRPEIDWKGNDASIQEEPLSITAFSTSILYVVFGMTDAVGRVISIIFSLLAIVYLFRLIKLYFNEKLALFTVFVYAILPLNVFFTRVLMQQSATIFLTIASLYYFSVYLSNENKQNLTLAIIFTSLVFLSRLFENFSGCCRFFCQVAEKTACWQLPFRFPKSPVTI